jgi:hypothetical protein
MFVNLLEASFNTSASAVVGFEVTSSELANCPFRTLFSHGNNKKSDSEL